jgi:hypothetical protein
MMFLDINHKFEGAWQNELMIMLKKQVSNPSKKWKSIGIVGAVQYIKAMDCTERTSKFTDSFSY